MTIKKRELILVVVLIAALALWALWPKSPGNTVLVTVNSQTFGSYSLSKDLSLPLSGYNGFSLTLNIQNGQAFVEDSTCPDLICQHHAPISETGEQIVCLPARIVITVTGEEAGVDAVTQ